MNTTLLETLRTTDLHKYNKPNNLCIDSILLHLRNILNTRAGCVLIANNYGMPDLTNFPGENLAQTIEELERLMKSTINRYEPRLKNIKINYCPDTSDNLTLKFSLAAEVFDDYEKTLQPVFFETVIKSNGMVKVEK